MRERKKFYPEACGKIEDRNDKSEGGRTVRRSVARFVSVRSTLPQSGAGWRFLERGWWGINSRSVPYFNFIQVRMLCVRFHVEKPISTLPVCRGQLKYNCLLLPAYGHGG